MNTELLTAQGRFLRILWIQRMTGPFVALVVMNALLGLALAIVIASVWLV